MKAGVRSILMIALVLALSSWPMAPALAHRLKLFVTVEAGTITGYAFFVGGGRAQAATVTITDPVDQPLYTAPTDANGAFSFAAPGPADYRITVDAGDGHILTAELGAERFAANNPPITIPAGSVAPPVAVGAADAGLSAAELAASLQPMIDAATERAVARQIRPLLEAQAAADGRLRFNDIVGGIGFIMGVFGTAAYVVSRRKAGAP